MSLSNEETSNGAADEARAANETNVSRVLPCCHGLISLRTGRGTIVVGARTNSAHGNQLAAVAALNLKHDGARISHDFAGLRDAAHGLTVDVCDHIVIA